MITNLFNAAIKTQADNLRQDAAIKTQADNLRQESGMWISLEEYARATHQNKRTLQRNIKDGVITHPIRNSLKPIGQKGAGREILTTDEITIKAVMILRRHRSAGLELEKKETIKEKSRTISLKVPYQQYLAGDFIKTKLPFTDYIKLLAITHDTQKLIHKHKRIWLRVSGQEHKIIANRAKEAGIQITDAYRMLYEKYVDSLLDLLPKN